MRTSTLLWICLLAVVFSSSTFAAGKAGYDPAADPAVDLKTAVERATAENKRILLEIGGEWCSWCHILDRFISEHPKVSGELEQGFIVLKINFSRENRNEDFLSRFPRISGYPHFFVLEMDGTFLHSQGTGDLEDGKGYSEERFLSFLQAWSPRSADSAEASGSVDAAATGAASR